MSEHGISESGFNRKRLDALLSEFKDDLKSIFGENFNVSPESPGGQLAGVVAESRANFWELIELAYNAYDVDAVTGVVQDNLYKLNGITRLLATSSTVTLTLSGTDGTLIPAGSLVSTSDTGAQFATDVDVTLSSGGTVTATAVETGEVLASVGTVVNIDTPITGWDTVTNATAATPGREKETDVEFRIRRNLSTGLNSQGIVDAIFATVKSLDGVTEVLVLENDTNATDADGVPAHSIHVVVSGGQDDDIARAIFEKKSLGGTFGTTTIDVVDDQNINHPISFSRPTAIDIYVVVNLTTFADYPGNGDDLIKAAIVDYAKGDLIAGRGFSLGDDVIHSEIYTPINTIPGHTVDSMFIKISDPADETLDISIAIDEISNFDIANITVNS